ncbi:hypothetical protein Val02_46510 [Virgisporangium aliadipatigenens]|uniref:Ricin B lectin domain-containing protein n=1 Tax=Virgisporangium aliadipatigenens TaxID=741659 RepID=A0A8J3YPT6_9ACTN|nr:RICIN domain-containing protein [Virgisporangium aliadipatigenens]GIJ47765.1 hypothetical protein Val02_46510 [Virgisporangium aliadipatigenens]
MRNRLTIALRVMAAAVFVASLGLAAPAEAAPSTGFFMIRSKMNNKCMVPKGSGTGNHVPIVMFTCRSGDPWQFWTVIDNNGTSKRFMNKHSGRCLDIAANSDGEVTFGTRLQTFSCDIAAQWIEDPFGANVLLRWANRPFCIDIVDRNPGNNVPVQMLDCKPFEDGQLWNYLPQTA